MTKIIISTLPSTKEAINAMRLSSLCDLILDLTNPEADIRGEAAAQSGAFLAHSAVRLARYVALHENKNV